MDNEFLTCDDKIERIGGALVGCAGDVSAIFRFLAWYRNPGSERPEFTNDDSFTAAVLDNKGIHVYFNSTYPSRVRDSFFAFGSGGMAAKAAMLCGLTPPEAVAIAIKCDKHSGGPVRQFSLKVDA
jgi:hypothetical protein